MWYLQVLLSCIFIIFNSLAVAKPSNIVFFLTDDQDLVLHGLTPMTKTLELIANKGSTFTNAFVSTPICCPSRSSILTGLYVHNHMAFNNSAAGGCAGTKWREIENNTFGAELHRAGYKTFYGGKYLNQYNADYVPEGWDHWIGLKQNSRYYNYTLSINGTNKYYPDEYLPDVLTEFAVDFITTAVNPDEPFLMVLAPPSPHSPSTPAPRHKGVFRNVTALQTPNFNRHYPDKHWLLTMPPEILSKNALQYLDEVYRNRWESLLAVDDMVEAVVQQLSNKNVLNDTYLVFTSDNGYHIGQFAQAYDKRQPYDTDVKVPLLISGPYIPPKSIVKVPVVNIDFAPTFLTLAGLPIPDYIDGRSFFENIFKSNVEISKQKATSANEVHELQDQTDGDSVERQILYEYWGEANPHTVSKDCPWRGDPNLARCDPEVDCRCQDVGNNTYSCVRHIAPDLNLLYCQFQDSENFMEAYNLMNDPYQMNNIAYTMLPAIREKYVLILKHLSACKGASCQQIY